MAGAAATQKCELPLPKYDEIVEKCPEKSGSCGMETTAFINAFIKTSPEACSQPSYIVPLTRMFKAVCTNCDCVLDVDIINHDCTKKSKLDTETVCKNMREDTRNKCCGEEHTDEDHKCDKEMPNLYCSYKLNENKDFCKCRAKNQNLTTLKLCCGHFKNYKKEKVCFCEQVNWGEGWDAKDKEMKDNLAACRAEKKRQAAAWELEEAGKAARAKIEKLKNNRTQKNIVKKVSTRSFHKRLQLQHLIGRIVRALEHP